MIKNLDEIKTSLNNTHLLGVEVLAKGFNPKLFAISGSIALKCYGFLNREIEDLDITTKTQTHCDEACRVLVENKFNQVKPDKRDSDYSYIKGGIDTNRFEFPFSKTKICVFVEESLLDTTGDFTWSNIDSKYGILKLANPIEILTAKLLIAKQCYNYEGGTIAMKHINDVIFYNENNITQFDIAKYLGMDVCNALKISDRVIKYCNLTH